MYLFTAVEKKHPNVVVCENVFDIIGQTIFFSYFFLDRLTRQNDRALKIKDCDLYPLTVICSKVKLRLTNVCFIIFSPTEQY